MFLIKRLMGRSDQLCPTHSLELSHVCYHKSCSDRRFLCSKCFQAHQGHELAPLQEYKNRLSRFQAELVYKDRVKAALDAYLDSVAKQVQKVCEHERACFLQRLQKTFYTREFAQAEDKYARGVDFFEELFSLRASPLKELWEEQIARLQELQKKVKDNITADCLRVSAAEMQLKRSANLKPGSLPKMAKLDRLMELLPFPCRLNLRFQASANSFLTKNLYALNIQAPIVVIIVSNKGRTFGGYSPNMFTASEEYIEDKRAESFLFSLDESEIMPIKPQFKKYAVKGGVNWGFGRGDLHISEECQKGGINWADVGHVYKKPVRFGEVDDWLAGSWYFRVMEYEVYEVIKEPIKGV